ncbi:hypothetical protein GIB67_001680 [Kingdonia uniflora]|uniref:Uncharacterized protein n=1 Tax=Kingdonia uniflora TaxID=39325 RepID=A0A7J7LMK1_9MAGN|nr:hypothetical protein GIB67_001680 [Kingdonia uniflora]
MGFRTTVEELTSSNKKLEADLVTAQQDLNIEIDQRRYNQFVMKESLAMLGQIDEFMTMMEARNKNSFDKNTQVVDRCKNLESLLNEARGRIAELTVPGMGKLEANENCAAYLDLGIVARGHISAVGTFPRGFAIEIIQVYSGPPTIMYKFRHWAYIEGPFKGRAPTGEKVQFHRIGMFQVNDTMEVEKVELFYDQGELLGPLLKGPKLDGSDASTTSSPGGCPFIPNY